MVSLQDLAPYGLPASEATAQNTNTFLNERSNL